ncbi:trimeric intracellular cation channel family protein [Caminibacter mediatlanticus TB-2]|uniref:Trimeric intracellular cation channel family protein n=1 Tax=Caminibacter mediatlanticus TB-2 TaxID=391592 RepID=A0ABX5VAG0_9BACT|nr:TRIC cation channel family protein [Caminibacter mediatlanticus]QCT93834.1 trimeric intracellular cation channel family protein [Caminibacter mediatlanticus TB-2]
MLEITDIIGIIAFAISGFVVGVRHKLDLLGVLISTFLTALGGGILRDVIANIPIYSFTNIFPGLVVFCVFLIGIVFKLYKFDFNNKFFLIFDSIGLVSFSISGSIVAINSEFNIFGVIFLSFITAVGGGMLRDILINQVPFILKEEFYGSISILIAFLLFIFGINDIVIISIFILGLILRLIAYIKGWKLPII